MAVAKRSKAGSTRHLVKNKIKTKAEIESLRQSGKILATVLEVLSRQIAPGQTTEDLAKLAASELKKLGGQPAFLGYQGFPDVICISVNDELVHGIPGGRVIEAGDLVGLDFGVNYNGMITDGAVTVGVGQISADAKRLLEATKQALAAGIDQVKDGVKVGNISAAIERRLRQDKLGVVEDLIGHGVGHEVHEEPGIPNFGPAGQGPVLRSGMSIAIEPMATLGGPGVVIADDGWTVRTADGSLSAQFEHTVLVTSEGAQILTQT